MRVRSETKREAILDAASAVFAETGFERASMSQIAARVGGSKATLYGYFPSKDALFAEVVKNAGERQLQPAFEELLGNPGDIGQALTRFGERYVAFLARADVLATQRMVLAESGHTDIGRQYYRIGPARGHAAIAAWLRGLMDEKRLRRVDPDSAAAHLLALMQSEILPRCLLGLRGAGTRPRVRAAVGRAVTAFMAAYSTR